MCCIYLVLLILQNVYNKRSPHLVPYSKVDEAIKKANCETASETVRTLLAYGYNLDAPTNESGESRECLRLCDEVFSFLCIGLVDIDRYIGMGDIDKMNNFICVYYLHTCFIHM